MAIRLAKYTHLAQIRVYIEIAFVTLTANCWPETRHSLTDTAESSAIQFGCSMYAFLLTAVVKSAYFSNFVLPF